MSKNSTAATASPVISTFWIRNPYVPSTWYVLPVADAPKETTKHPNSIDYVLGATLPIVVLGTPTGRDWTFTLNITDPTLWSNLRPLLNSGTVLLIMDPVNKAHYYVSVVADVETTHYSSPPGPWRQTPVQFVEVAKPADVIA